MRKYRIIIKHIRQFPKIANMERGLVMIDVYFHIAKTTNLHQKTVRKAIENLREKDFEIKLKS